MFLFNAYVSIKGPDSPSLEFKELLENEKNNFRLVNTAVSYLGGVPAMINPADMSNTIPSEKVRRKRYLTCLFVNHSGELVSSYIFAFFLKFGFVCLSIPPFFRL